MKTKFNIEDGSEGWTPIDRCKVIPKNQAGDGSKFNPIVYKAEMLPNLYHAKEVSFHKIDGTPGFRFRRGKINKNYEWLPIVYIVSPVANRTRAKIITIYIALRQITDRRS